MQFTETELDSQQQRLKNLEIRHTLLQEHVSMLTESLKDTQRYLVKLASNQMELNKRVSTWPYIETTPQGKGK